MPLIVRIQERFAILRVIQSYKVPFNLDSEFGGHSLPSYREGEKLNVSQMVAVAFSDRVAYIDLRSLDNIELQNLLSRLSSGTQGIRLSVSPEQLPNVSRILQTGEYYDGYLIIEEPSKRIVTESSTAEAEK